MTRRGFVGALCIPAHAETRAEKGRQAIQDVINALGADNFRNMQNRVETGRAVTLDRERLSGLSHAKIYTEYLRTPQPGKLGVHERQFFGTTNEVSILFLDGKGYDISFQGARPLAKETLERYYLSTRHNIFYILRQRLKEPGMIVELTGHDAIENQSADIIDFYDADNENVTVWVNSFTHLPFRQRWYRREKDTGYRYEEITHYTKYRQFISGISWPMDLQRERDGERIAEIYNDDIKFNVVLKEDIFLLPPGIKMLSDSR
jgi:hypothetical protein